jgi:mRNA-degrading endonuclease RelE of RelBE toxin-antitoxin system
MPVSCSINFTDFAKDDFSKLPREIQKECYNLLKKLQTNMHMGRKLDNNGIRDLSDWYKLYFHNAEYRVIYIKRHDTISVEGITSITQNIAEVVGIGQRADYKIYDEIAERLNRFVKGK